MRWIIFLGIGFLVLMSIGIYIVVKALREVNKLQKSFDSFEEDLQKVLEETGWY